MSHKLKMPQLLPSKERSLFQQVVKNYESKQYKKGESAESNDDPPTKTLQA